MHRILTRHRLNRLAWLDWPAGRLICRYERSGPGELVHVDIKKPGNIPDGGGHRVMDRRSAADNKIATTDQRRSYRAVIGYSYVDSAVDRHTRCL